MAERRFSEFHCNILPNDPKSVAIVADETKNGVITQHSVVTSGNSLIDPTQQRVIPDGRGGVSDAGPITPDDKTTAEKLVRACRTALQP